MGEQRKLASAVSWYEKSRGLFEDLARKTASLLEELLAGSGTQPHKVTWRAKEVTSFETKIANSKYERPADQVTDLAGIRVTCLLATDVAAISKLIESSFEIDEANSVDKTSSLGVDRVGYRSVHYVCQFLPSRLELPEYRRFKGLRFEIQVRTILQDAWAEIEHDRNYKFQGVLPDPVKRRFAVLAGVLELADREFESIVEEIESYATDIALQTEKGDLSAPVNTTSLTQYLMGRLDGQVAGGLRASFGGKDGATEVISELNKFGCETLNDVKPLVDNILDAAGDDHTYLMSTTFLGFLRDAMIIMDWQRYFDKAWQGNWGGTDRASVEFWNKQGVPSSQILGEYNIDLLPDWDGF